MHSPSVQVLVNIAPSLRDGQWHAAEVVAEHTGGDWAVRFENRLPGTTDATATGLVRLHASAGDVIACGVETAPWADAAAPFGVSSSTTLRKVAHASLTNTGKAAVEAALAAVLEGAPSVFATYAADGADTVCSWLATYGRLRGAAPAAASVV